MTEQKSPYTAITPESEADMTDIERAFLMWWRRLAPDNAPQPVAQFYYALPIKRYFRADFAWPEARLLLECQGGVFTRQAHGSISGILRDNERLNIAARLGWRMMRCTTKDLDEHPSQFIERVCAALGVL